MIYITMSRNHIYNHRSPPSLACSNAEDFVSLFGVLKAPNEISKDTAS